MRRYYYLIVFVCLIFTSCEKTVTEIEYKDKMYSWTQDSRLQYDKSLIINSHSNDENLYLMGFYNYTKISKTETNTYSLPFDYSVDNKFPITDNYYVAADKQYDYVVIVPNDYPHASWSRKTFFLKNLDSLFYEFEFGYYTNGECIAISDNDYCVIPYRIKNDIGIGNMPRILMIGLDVKEVRHDIVIDTTNTKIIELGESGTTNYVYNIKNIEDRFLISCGSKTYHVDTSGNVSVSYEGVIDRYLIHNDLYYGIAWVFSENNLLQSSDKGRTWDEIGKIPNDFTLLNYSSVGDSLIGFYDSQLFSVKVSDNSISSRELDNDGLIGKEITSISSFTDSLIYVTTLNGLFYRNKMEFFNNKIE